MEENRKKEPLWTATFINNMLINFIFYLVFYLLTVIIGTVAVADMGASASLAGILSGIFIVGGFIGRLWTGNNISRIGQKKTLIIGTIIYLLFTLFYFFIHSITLLLIIRLLHGIGFGIAATASGTLAGLVVPTTRRGEGIGYYALSVTLASAIGPFLSIFLYHTFNYTVLLVLSTVLLILALGGEMILSIPDHVKTAYKKIEKKAFSWANYFEKTALPIAFIAFLMGIAYSSILSFLANFTAEIGLATAGSFFFLVYAIFSLASRPVTGRLFDSRGENFVLYPAFVIFSLGLALIAGTHASIILLIAAALVGLGFGSFSPFGQAVAIRDVKPERLGIATSTFFGLYDMGVGFGPFGLGLLEPFTGYRNLYLISAGFVLVIIFIYWLIHGRRVGK